MNEVIPSLAIDQLVRFLTVGLHVQHIDGLPTTSYTPWTGGQED